MGFAHTHLLFGKKQDQKLLFKTPWSWGFRQKSNSKNESFCINRSREHPLQGLGRRPMTLTLWLDLELALDLNIEKEGEPNEL